jgi:hypothetical protein
VASCVLKPTPISGLARGNRNDTRQKPAGLICQQSRSWLHDRAARLSRCEPGILGLVATRRASKLWPVVIGALALAGCSSGQTVPPTTRTGITTTTQAVVPSTTQPNRAVVTGKVVPCTGEPTPLPGAIFNSVDLDTTGEQVVAPAPVLQDGTYRFTDVTPGHYELTEGPTGSPQIIQPISVHSSQTLVVDLPSCPPTAGGNYKLASAEAVHHFLVEAQSDNQGFVATYRTLDSDVGPETFVYAQQPQGRPRDGSTWSPHGTGDFLYIARRGDESLRFIQRNRGDYICVQKAERGPWTCQGPNDGVRSIGDYYLTEQFDEQALVTMHMTGHFSLGRTWIWSGRLGGAPATCLRYLDQDSTFARTTWCINASGVTVFAVASSFLNVEVVKFSTSAPTAEFSLPARPTPWQDMSSRAARASRLSVERARR